MLHSKQLATDPRYSPALTNVVKHPLRLAKVRSIGDDSHSSEVVSSYNYNAEGGKSKKATLENVFGPVVDMNDNALDIQDQDSKTPWNLGWQMSERNIVWNDELKVRLIKHFAISELGISNEEMEWRLGQLASLLPGLTKRLMIAPPHVVARLAAHTSEVGQRLLRLRSIFPQADLEEMVGQRLTLLYSDDMDMVAVSAARLRVLLKGLDIDRFVSMHPLVLDIEGVEMALQDCKRIMPNIDPVTLLANDPDMVLSLVKGKNLLPYDGFENPWS